MENPGLSPLYTAEVAEIRQALEACEARHAALVAQVRDYAIFALDLGGRATSWNEGVEHVLGWGREEFQGLAIEKLFPPEDIAAGLHHQELHRAAQEGSAYTERWLHRKDGTPFFATMTTTRVVDSTGHVVGFSKVIQDRTIWKRQQDERDALLESERRAREQCEQANRLKDEFLATLSHELRSPLNAIIGWVHILRRHAAVSPELARGLETIERNARTQTQIINDLLDMSRIMTGKVRLNLRPTSLQEVLMTALDAIGPAAQAKSIRVSSTLDPSIERIRGDAVRLRQVFWHLLTNAVKFTPAGGQVHVRLERSDSQALISVADTGVGIAPAFLPFIFDRFRQPDASISRAHTGLGVGLSIVKNLVELHGGQVRALSPGEGAGATFIVTLPLPQPHHVLVPTTHPTRESVVDTTALMPKLTGISTLVVDDEIDSLMFAARLLEETGARVMVALDVQQALDTLKSENVDILISDIGMANEDGFDLIARVRALDDERISRVPAIALTAYARAEDRQRLLLAGFQMHISKPVEPQELVAGIASLVGVTGKRIPTT